MVFSSPIFLFGFLPITLFVVLSLSRKAQNLALLFFSLIFYAWGEGELVIIMLASIIANYIFGIAISNFSTKGLKKIILLISVTFNLGLLAFYKYANFLTDNINSIFANFSIPQIQLESIHLPIGISFFTFQSLSYVIDVYRGEAKVQKNPLNLGLYIALFPQLIAGPIVRYHDIAQQIISRRININKFYSGTRRFIVGLAKKVLIANTVGSIADQIFSLNESELGVGVAWLGVICYSLQIFFDFSGYSDMAIGIGRMFGFDFLENFNFPYIAKSIKDFWRRWHISLSTWFRDYLYIPLGGNKISGFRTYLNLSIVFFLTGLWHGASWNFIVWGLFHGFFLILERLGLDKILNKSWQPLRHTYTLLVVLIGWVFFRSENLGASISYIGAMFGANGFSQNNSIMEYLQNIQLIAIFVGFLSSVPISRYVSVKLFRLRHKISIKQILFTKNVIVVSKHLYLVVLLYLSIIFLSSSTYNPFIYYQF